jgi:hypothetical protein
MAYLEEPPGFNDVCYGAEDTKHPSLRNDSLFFRGRFHELLHSGDKLVVSDLHETQSLTCASLSP